MAASPALAIRAPVLTERRPDRIQEERRVQIQLHLHLATALLALGLGTANLILAKGPRRHRVFG